MRVSYIPLRRVALLCLLHRSFTLSLTMSQSPAGSVRFDGPFGINVAFSVKPERRDEFLKVMQSNVEKTLATEQNVLQFVLGEDVEATNRFYLHEEYVSIEDHREEHSKTKHFQDCLAFFQTNPFTEPHKADEYLMTHDPVKIPPRPAFCLNVELCIKPERYDEFLDVIENNSQGSNQEPLCLQYSYGESITTPGSFYFHEQYTGEKSGLEGFTAHTKAPHFLLWEEFAATDPFSKEPVVQKFRAM